MAKKPKHAAAPEGGEPTKKQRTREHEIADLSLNYVERLALKAGCVAQRQSPDYGYDLRLETFDPHGEVEDGEVLLQLKATENIQAYALASEECFSFPISAKDFRLWSKALMPMFLILYDARLEEAYWLHVQDYLATRSPQLPGNTVNVHIPHHQVAGVQTIRMMRQRKNECVAKIVEALARETGK